MSVQFARAECACGCGPLFHWCVSSGALTDLIVMSTSGCYDACGVSLSRWVVIHGVQYEKVQGRRGKGEG